MRLFPSFLQLPFYTSPSRQTYPPATLSTASSTGLSTESSATSPSTSGPLPSPTTPVLIEQQPADMTSKSRSKSKSKEPDSPPIVPLRLSTRFKVVELKAATHLDDVSDITSAYAASLEQQLEEAGQEGFETVTKAMREEAADFVIQTAAATKSLPAQGKKEVRRILLMYGSTLKSNAKGKGTHRKISIGGRGTSIASTASPEPSSDVMVRKTSRDTLSAPPMPATIFDMPPEENSENSIVSEEAQPVSAKAPTQVVKLPTKTLADASATPSAMIFTKTIAEDTSATPLAMISDKKPVNNAYTTPPAIVPVRTFFPNASSRSLSGSIGGNTILSAEDRAKILKRRQRLEEETFGSAVLQKGLKVDSLTKPLEPQAISATAHNSPRKRPHAPDVSAEMTERQRDLKRRFKREQDLF